MIVPLHLLDQQPETDKVTRAPQTQPPYPSAWSKMSAAQQEALVKLSNEFQKIQEGEPHARIKTLHRAGHACAGEAISSSCAAHP